MCHRGYSAKSLALSLVLALLAAGCSGPTRTDQLDLVVDSFVQVEIDEMNARVAEAVEAGEEWPFDALAAARQFVTTAGARYVNIEKVCEKGESPQSTVVTVITGDYLDDSVRGTWNQMLMSRGTDGAWRLDELRRAWRCYRGYQTETFGERWCS